MRKNIALLGMLAMAAIALAGYRFIGDMRAAPAADNIRIAIGGPAGVYSAYGEILANLLGQRLKTNVTTLPSGGSIDNVNLLRGGKADIAFVQNDIMTHAYNGTAIFSTDGPFKDFYAIAALYPETCQIVARRGITGIAELKGMRVSVGAEGSGTELNALQILESFGIGYADIYADHLGFSASVSAFRNGSIDAFFCTAGLPTPAISELAAGGEAHLLSVGEAHSLAIISQYPYYSRQTIPKGTYPGADEDRDTLAVKAALAVSGRLSDDTVSDILKTVFENAGSVKAIIPGGTISREYASEGLAIPMHPGAEKFFFGNRGGAE